MAQTSYDREKAIELHNIWLLGNENRSLIFYDTDNIRQEEGQIFFKVDTTILGPNTKYFTRKPSFKKSVEPTIIKAVLDGEKLKPINSYLPNVVFNEDGSVAKVYYNEEDNFTHKLDTSGRVKELLFGWYRAYPSNPWKRQRWTLNYNSKNQLESIYSIHEYGEETRGGNIVMANASNAETKYIQYLDDHRRGIKIAVYRAENPDFFVDNADSLNRYFIGDTYYSGHYSHLTKARSGTQTTFDDWGRKTALETRSTNGALTQSEYQYADKPDSIMIESFGISYDNDGKTYGGTMTKKIIYLENGEESKPNTIYVGSTFKNRVPFYEWKEGKARVKLASGEWSPWSSEPKKYSAEVKVIEEKIWKD